MNFRLPGSVCDVTGLSSHGGSRVEFVVFKPHDVNMADALEKQRETSRNIRKKKLQVIGSAPPDFLFNCLLPSSFHIFLCGKGGFGGIRKEGNDVRRMEGVGSRAHS